MFTYLFLVMARKQVRERVHDTSFFSALSYPNNITFLISPFQFIHLGTCLPKPPTFPASAMESLHCYPIHQELYIKDHPSCS